MLPPNGRVHPLARVWSNPLANTILGDQDPVVLATRSASRVQRGVGPPFLRITNELVLVANAEGDDH